MKRSWNNTEALEAKKNTGKHWKSIAKQRKTLETIGEQ
jgi:hypothetical protein